jgi:hypothetical protein
MEESRGPSANQLREAAMELGFVGPMPLSTHEQLLVFLAVVGAIGGAVLSKIAGPGVAFLLDFVGATFFIAFGGQIRGLLTTLFRGGLIGGILAIIFLDAEARSMMNGDELKMFGVLVAAAVLAPVAIACGVSVLARSRNR